MVPMSLAVIEYLRSKTRHGSYQKINTAILAATLLLTFNHLHLGLGDRIDKRMHHGPECIEYPWHPTIK